MTQATDLGSIANMSRTLFHAHLNTGFQALATGNSGTADPHNAGTTYPYMTWYDTTAHLIKIRNGSNSAWLTVGTIDTNTFSWSSTSTTTGTLGTGALSGSTVDTTGIPAGITAFDLVLIGVGCSTLSSVALCLGTSAGMVTTGYSSAGENVGGTAAITAGAFWLGLQSAATALNLVGNVRGVLSSSNRWSVSGVTASTNIASDNSIVAGTVVLPGTVDRYRILTTAGTFSQGTAEMRWFK